MTSIGSPSPFFLAGKKAYEVDRSLRFNDDDSPRLTRTLASDGNRRKWTWSCWFKPSSLGAGQVFLLSQRTSSSNQCHIMLSTDQVDFESGGGKGRVKTQAVFRDVSAWYHLVLHLDSDNSTASDRVKIYINGVQQEVTIQTTVSTGDHGMNNNNQQQIGAQADTNNLFYDGYLAEINFIDGQAYDPSYFGETNVVTGQWNPKEYTGSYGSQGFYLNFSDNSGTTATTLGKDSSGNGNNFTPNNLATNDAVKDSPTNNFCVFNLLSKDGGSTLSNGNLQISSSDYGNNTGTFFLTSGKWYWEGLGNGYVGGICGNSGQNYSFSISGSGSKSIGYWHLNGWAYWDGGNSGAGTSYSTSDVIGIALDMDNGTLKFYKNNTLIHDLTFGSGTIPDLTAGAFPVWNNGTSNNSKSANYNFGQDSSFAGNKTAQGNTDGSGQGDFYYAPPTGFKALCSANLPDPTIKLPNKHFDTKLFTGNGSSQTISGLNFAPDWVWLKCRNSSGSRSHILTDRIRGATKSLLLPETDAEGTFAQDLTAFTSDGFSVGSNGRVNENSTNLVAWNWNAGDTDGKTYTVKVVSDSGNKYRFDDFGTSAVTLDLAEGGTYTFDGSDSTMASHPIKLSTTANGTHGGGSSYNTGVTYELDGSTVTESAYVSGYSSATSRKLIITVAAYAPTLYYYCYYHSGMGGQINTNSTLGSSNFDGTIQSTVKANTSAGFSIVSFTSDGTSLTAGHGLGVSPDVIIKKQRNASSDWYVFHKSLAVTETIKLNEASAKSTSSDFANTSPTSTVFSSYTTGVSGRQIIAYCFSEVAGYSKFGSYKGNGNSNGTFVFTGFRPAWILVKRTSASENWALWDNKRDGGFNPNGYLLRPDSFTSEGGNVSGHQIDILSNGFKFRNSDSKGNGSGSTYIYLAFAESPFKNARAR